MMVAFAQILSKRDVTEVRLLSSPGRVQSAWLRLTESRVAAFVLFAVVYTWPTIALARRKLFWDDEFFTLYLSKIPTWHDLLAALATGADQHPPSFYYLTHLIIGLAGTTHVTLRLTAIVGFGITCLCLYEIVSRILDRQWGMAAMFLPLTSWSYYYATEGRGYGLELGFVSLALLMWMLACEGRRRALTTPLLAAGLCGAVASHYYAGLVLIPFAAGELVRTRIRGKIDLPVWVAFGGALLPVFAFARTIRSAQSYSAHFWAEPHWNAMLIFYPGTIGHAMLVLLAAIALAAVLGIAGPAPEPTAEPRPRLWYGIAFLLLALLPVFGVTLAMLVTHAYTDRYVVAAFPGVCLVVILGLRRIAGNNPLAAALICASCLPFFALQWHGLYTRQLLALRETRDTATFLRHAGDGPIAMAEVTPFHRLSFYARRDLARRLAYVADPHASIRYLRHDTLDRGLLALNPWFPLNVVWLHDWSSSHPSFLVYGYVGEWSWLTFELPRLSDSIRLLDRNRSHLLFSVQRLKPPADDRMISDPSGEPVLYRQLPDQETPLCMLYMQKDSCLVVDDPGTGAPSPGYHY
jgi:Dolichyl-phosphate-mannose-protein mannosyltransferase